MGLNLTVVSLYHFTEMLEIELKKKELLLECRALSILGTFIISNEGINGTVCGEREAIEQIISVISNWPEVKDLNLKYSETDRHNFSRMKVKIKKEIVTMGKPDVNPNSKRGKYVDPSDWNEVVSKEDILLIDTRNKYETKIGKFKNSIDPQTENFREFPEWARELYDRLSASPEGIPKVAMYCTGGIRCEKASAFMLDLGFPEVFHLKGGILKYLEDTPESDSLWDGECFVFDDRVSLKHGLGEGNYSLCYSCQNPLSQKDRESVHYEEGVKCHICQDVITESKLVGARERKKQIQLSKYRGQEHVGDYSESRKLFDLTDSNG